jgi:Ca2+-binding RTX toxin-like protein
LKFGPADFEIPFTESKLATIRASSSAVITGTAAADLIYGHDGADTLYGRAGDDRLWGGLGADKLYGDSGTDTLYGEAGNDILMGGTGVSYLYGGEGDDALHYNPVTGSLAAGVPLADSVLDGGSGRDALHIYNKATFTLEGETTPTTTRMTVTSQGAGTISFLDDGDRSGGASHDVGSFSGIEKVTVTGAGRLEFYGGHGYADGIDVTGTAGNDLFYSDTASDTMRSGGGDDTFLLSGYGGTDTIISGGADNDIFRFDVSGGADARISGFNGAGTELGDRLYFEDMMYGRSLTASIVESAGKTLFTIQADGGEFGSTTVTVDKIGLVADVDYFFA